MPNPLAHVHHALDRALAAARLVHGSDLTSAMAEVGACVSALDPAALGRADLDAVYARIAQLRSLCALLKDTTYGCLARVAAIEGAGYQSNLRPRRASQALVRRYG